MSLSLRVAVAAALLGFASEARAVEGGTEDRATSHAVAIARGAPGVSSVECSGTLISPNVVLTVRHCIAPVVEGARPCDVTLGPVPATIAETLWVDVSPWTDAGARWKKVIGARVPEPTSICGDDIALLVLAEPVPESEAVPARPVVDEASFLAYAKERTVGLAAFGVTDPRASDLGVRRSRFDIPIRCVPGTPGFACGAELDFIGDRELTTGAGPCRGDSGGGAMPASDRGVVFGVLSRGDVSRDEATCSLGVFERTDVWAWLIARAVLDAASDRAPAPAWASQLFPAQPKQGDFCVGNGSCGATAQCVSTDGRRSFSCADTCTSDATCTSDRRCENGVCLPRPPSSSPPSDGGGCAIGRSTSSHARALVALGLTLVVAFSARRDRSDRSAASSDRAR